MIGAKGTMNVNHRRNADVNICWIDNVYYRVVNETVISEVETISYVFITIKIMANVTLLLVCSALI